MEEKQLTVTFNDGTVKINIILTPTPKGTKITFEPIPDPSENKDISLAESMAVKYLRFLQQ